MMHPLDPPAAGPLQPIPPPAPPHAAVADPPRVLDEEIALLRALVHRLAAPPPLDPAPAAPHPALPHAAAPAADPHLARASAPPRRRAGRRGGRGARLIRRATAAARCIEVLARTLRVQASLGPQPADVLDEALRTALDDVWDHLESCPDHFTACPSRWPAGPHQAAEVSIPGSPAPTEVAAGPPG